MRLRILPEAELDLGKGADFYELQNPGSEFISMTACIRH
jgi:hypothetical protein